MAKSTEAEILDVARRFLEVDATEPEAADLMLPEVLDWEEVFTVAFRDRRLPFDAVTESLRVRELSKDSARVGVSQRLVPKRGKCEEQNRELTLELVDSDGWKVSDIVVDGHSLAGSMHRVLVEPPAADGLTVRGWARSDPDGKVSVAIMVRNSGPHAWQSKNAGTAWQKGRMWFLAQAFWKMFFLGDYGTAVPGTDRGVLLTVPAKAECIWLKASRWGSLRSPLFALSWEGARRASLAEPLRWDWQYRVDLGGMALPFVGLGVFIAILASPRAALIGLALFTVAAILDTHLCVYRLKRKLARFRAEVAARGLAN
jgi:hypothetical protein